MAPAVVEYVNAIPPAHRPLFDRIHLLILDTCPDATVVLSYKMPTYQIGIRRLHLGARKHGVSLDEWKGQGDGGAAPRPPDLDASGRPIRIRSYAAAAIPAAGL